MELKLLQDNGTLGAGVQASSEVFERKYNEALVHQVVVAYRANARSGNRAQKDREQVKHTTKKPWRQKGTGRARAGTIRSPIWRGGGATFAAKPRDHEQKLNKKMYRAALQCILSELNRQERLIVVESFDIEAPKTKALVQKLAQFNLTDVLIVTEEISENLFLASRNLYKVGVSDAQGVDPVSLIGFDKVVVTVPALKKFEEILG